MASEIAAAWDDVRSDASPAHWLIVRASGDLKSIELAGTGESGLEGFLQQFESAETATWGAMRVRAVDDRGTVKSVRAKFIRVNLLPDSMTVIKRAKAGPLKGQVDEVMPSTHASFDVSSAGAVTRASIERQLQMTCGAHKPSYYDFDGAEGADAAASAKPKGLAAAPSASDSAPPPADEDGDGPPPPGDDDDDTAAGAPPPPSPPRATEDKAAVPQDIAAAWNAVKGGSEPTNWVALTYDGKDVGTARVLDAGSDGLDGLKDALDDELVIFAGLRVTAIDDRGTVKSIRPKYVFVQFIGGSVKPIVRAKAGPAKSHFENLLAGTHLSVSIASPSDLTAADIEKKLHANCGAHQPNRYEFGAKITDGGSL